MAVAAELTILSPHSDFSTELVGAHIYPLPADHSVFIPLREHAYRNLHANTINYALGWLQNELAFHQNQDFQSFHESQRHLLDNMSRAASEFPLIQARGLFTSTYKWSVVDGKQDLNLGNNSMRQVLEESLNSSQALAQEYPRFQRDLENFNALAEARASGYKGKWFFISPHPDGDQELLAARGYWNMEYVMLSELDEQGNEVFHQRWFPKQDRDQHLRFLQNLQNSNGELFAENIAAKYILNSGMSGISDTNLMSIFGKITEGDSSHILEYIQAIRQPVADNLVQIEEFAAGLDERLRTEVHGHLDNIVQKWLVHGDGIDINQELEAIFMVLKETNLNLRNKIQAVSGLNMFSDTERTGIAQFLNGRSPAELNTHERMQLLHHVHFISCGYGQRGINNSSPWGLTTSIFGDSQHGILADPAVVGEWQYLRIANPGYENKIVPGDCEAEGCRRKNVLVIQGCNYCAYCQHKDTMKNRLN